MACGMSLLAAARAVGLATISWWFILVFTACVAGINYAISRAARDRPFRTWLAHANIAIGTAMISAVAYASGPSGDVLFPAYLIGPFQAAYYLGAIEAWEALVLNVAGFGLATALPAGWGWVAFVKEVLVLVFVCVAMIPTLASIVARVRATREVLAQVERGDLTVRVTDPRARRARLSGSDREPNDGRDRPQGGRCPASGSRAGRDDARLPPPSRRFSRMAPSAAALRTPPRWPPGSPGRCSGSA